MTWFLALSILLQTEPARTSTKPDPDPQPPYAGLEYVGLDVVAKQYQITWTSDAATGREILRATGTTIIVSPSLQTALVNGVPEKLSRPVLVISGRVSVPVELARRLEGAVKRRAVEVTGAKPLVKPTEAPKKQVLKGCRIVIDPGHGGMHTGGKGGSGLLEKSINLDVSLKLRALLEELGGEVVMTRMDDRHFDADVHADLQHRVNVVNRERPDLFLSVHTNYVDRPEPRGFEVWVRRGGNARSKDLALTVEHEFRSLGLPDRGIKESGFYVLKHTTCTAVLVELEFVSNPEAEKLLASGDYRTRLAETLAAALRKYLEKNR